MHIRGIEQQARVLSAAEEIGPVQFAAEIGHEVRNVRDAQVVSGVGGFRVGEGAPAVAQILPSAVGVEVAPARHVGFDLRFDAHGAHLSEIGVARHRGQQVGSETHHVGEFAHIDIDLGFPHPIVGKGPPIEHTGVHTLVAFGEQIGRRENVEAVAEEFFACGDTHFRSHRAFDCPKGGDAIASGEVRAPFAAIDVNGLDVAQIEVVQHFGARADEKVFRRHGCLQPAVEEERLVGQAGGEGGEATVEVGGIAQRAIHQFVVGLLPSAGAVEVQVEGVIRSEGVFQIQLADPIVRTMVTVRSEGTRFAAQGREGGIGAAVPGVAHASGVAKAVAPDVVGRGKVEIQA